MDDLISRQAAIDALMEILDRPNHAEFLYTDEVCKTLNELPSAQPEQRWIPVTERLPEEDDYRPCYGYEDGAVWWCNDSWMMGLGWYYPSTGNWAYYDDLDKCEKYVGNVVAWMPIPELYREEEQDATD